jgi:hypothetical protein
MPPSTFCEQTPSAPVVFAPNLYAVNPNTSEDELGRVIAGLRPGDELVLAAGVYRRSFAFACRGEDGRPITIRAERPGAVVITGADVVEGWRPAAGVAGAWERELDLGALTASPQHGELAGRCEQVFVDGAPLRQVLRREDLRGGRFYYDAAGKVLVIMPVVNIGEQRGGSTDLELGLIAGGGTARVDRAAPEHRWPVMLRAFDPANHRVEVTRRRRIFATAGHNNDLDGGCAHLVISGLVFRASGDAPQQAMVYFGGRHLVVEDCRFEHGAARGFDLRTNDSVVRRCVARLNGQMGFSGYGARNLVEDCALLFNNTKHASFGCFEQGGCKIVKTRDWVVRRVRVAGNDGPGIWFDIDNVDALIERCRCEDNTGPGIMYEISSGAVIRNNLCLRNGAHPRKDYTFDAPAHSMGEIEAVYGQGILVQMSRGCRVYNNTCVGNRRTGIELRHHPYQQAGQPGHATKRYRLRDNEVFNNVLADNGGDALVVSPPPLNPAKADEVADNRHDHNLYHHSGALRQRGGDLADYARFGKTQGGCTQSLEEWRALRDQDANSVQWDPAFVDPEGADYRPETYSVVVGRGRPAPELTEDYHGSPRPTGRAPSLGACEP